MLLGRSKAATLEAVEAIGRSKTQVIFFIIIILILTIFFIRFAEDKDQDK
jgi:hypothetical protein